MNLFRWRRTALGCLYLGIAVGFASFFLGGQPEFQHNVVIVCLSLFCAFFTLDVLFWKCPKCGKNFPHRHRHQEQYNCCPFCGERLK